MHIIPRNRSSAFLVGMLAVLGISGTIALGSPSSAEAIEITLLKPYKEQTKLETDRLDLVELQDAFQAIPESGAKQKLAGEIARRVKVRGFNQLVEHWEALVQQCARIPADGKGFETVNTRARELAEEYNRLSTAAPAAKRAETTWLKFTCEECGHTTQMKEVKDPDRPMYTATIEMCPKCLGANLSVTKIPGH
jgi:hypothetical protein